MNREMEQLLIIYQKRARSMGNWQSSITNKLQITFSEKIMRRIAYLGIQLIYMVSSLRRQRIFLRRA